MPCHTLKSRRKGVAQLVHWPEVGMHRLASKLNKGESCVNYKTEASGKPPERKSNMIMCQRKSTSVGKWIFAGLLFMLTMTFSLAEVNAGNYQYYSSGSNGNSTSNQPPTVQASNVDMPARQDSEGNTACVPEPTTMLLMASGLGLMLLNRKRKIA